jgi:hypothetical protein
MKINWNPNPLATTVDVDDNDKKRILLYIQSERYENILCGLDLWLDGEIDKDTPITIEEIRTKVSRWSQICDMETDHKFVQEMVEELQRVHVGDCTCFAMSCIKCHAEAALGIDTIKGLGKHQAHKIMGAFTNGKNIDEAIQHLRKPYRYEDRHSSWEKYSREDYERHTPRWQAENDAAIAWLQRYREEHGF